MPKATISDSLVYEDADYLVLNKPPGLATLEDRSDPRNLLSLVREFEPRAQVGHRLDKETSGVLIVARHPEAYRHISMQFEGRHVRKVYHAVVHGIHRFNHLEVNRAIQIQKDGTVRLANAGKSAQTFFDTLEVYQQHSLLQCEPITGRMHQIRIHAASVKAPLVSDSTYGGNPIYLADLKPGFKLKKGAEAEPLIKRVALHAYAVEFQLLDGSVKQIEATYPKDFRALVNQLRRQTR